MKYRQCINEKPIRKRILILCEGGKTEPNYFNAIKTDKNRSNQLSGLRIQVHNTKKNTAKELVAEAIDLKREAERERNSYDEIWVVFDRDGYTKHPESFDRARAKNISIAFSSPCFEFWYFLHFHYSSSAIVNGDAMCDRLKKYIADYDKAENYYETLKPLTDIAVENGERIIRHWAEVGNGPIWNFNPYTDVGKLVEKLISLL